MDKQQMLERIYDVIADKTLSFGCVIKSKLHWLVTITEIFDVCDDDIKEHVLWNGLPHWEQLYLRYKMYSWNVSLNDIKSVIWHPVMIGDVYQWLFDNRMECNVVYAKNPIRWWKVEPYSNNKEFIFHRRENRRKPIDDQSDECIKFVYDLLPTK